MKRLVCLLPSLCLFVPSTRAQSTSATISGGVTDGAGRLLPDAAIDIANDATGLIYSVKTNSSGIYFVPILPPGHYHVQVSKEGFKTIIKPDVVLNVQSAIALNFSLPVGAKSESITVQSGGALLNTTDAAVSTVVDRHFVENMPLNGRSFQDLISMTPGVVSQTPQVGTNGGVNYSGNFSVNGQRTESNYYTVDGVSANSSAGTGNGTPQAATGGSLGAATALGTTQSLLSVDALEEFRVVSSSYSAEYGRTPGGQFSLLTRSGTAMTHGTLFDYLRNDLFDANDWFNNHYAVSKPALRQNDFGGTLGGRIPLGTRALGDTFYFVSYEGLRLSQPVPASVQYVPDLALRQRAPAALRPLLNAYPLPTTTARDIDYGTSASPNLATFIQGYSLPSRIDSTSVRVDHSFGRSLALFFRYSQAPSEAYGRSLSQLTQTRTGTTTYTLGATSAFTDHVTNEFRLGHSDSTSRQAITLDTFGGADPSNYLSASGLGSYPSSGVYFYLSFTGVGNSTLNTQTTQSQLSQWNVIDTLNLTLGKHLLKAGFDYRRVVSPLSPVPVQVQAAYFTPASVLANSATLYLSKQQPASPVYDQTAAFIQDEWRLRRNVGLSLGLRWEVNPAVGEANGLAPYTLTGNLNRPTSLGFAPRGTPLFKTAWANVAPRLGVAWTVRDASEWSTVLRAGGGVFFDSVNQVSARGFYSVGFVAYQTLSAGSLPIVPAQLNFSPSGNAPYSGTVVYAYPEHLQLPYSLQWNVAVEQALGKSQSLTLNYVAANGRRLLSFQQFSLGALNPSFGTVDYIPSGITSNYQALQAKLQRSVGKGLHALVAYTWAHSLDFGSTYAAIAQSRGNSDFDVRNSFSAGVSWDLPSTDERGVVASLGQHWGVDLRASARTAFPVTLNGNTLTDPTTGNQYFGGLNLLPNQPLYVQGAQYPGGKAINKAAFTAATGTARGTAPRNLIRGFGELQMNAALRREFPLGGTVHLGFRAEAFNFLNRPNFGYINPFFTQATFGQVTRMLNQSLVSVASQYQEGGSRSMQFALKLSF